MPSVLVLTNSPVLSMSDIHSALGCVYTESKSVQINDANINNDYNASNANVHVMTSGTVSQQCRRIEKLYDQIVVVIEKAGNYGHETLTKDERRTLIGAAAKMVRPGGHLGVRQVVQNTRDVDSCAASLRTELIMLGMTSVSVKDDQEELVIMVNGEKRERREAEALRVAPAQDKVSWKIAAGDDENDDLIDEEDLLGDDIAIVEAAPAACGPSTKKACANCTCGRAEGKVTKLTKEMIDNPQSGCGSCALGDAFRCAGCPYRGLPAFEIGKKIELPSDFLVDDLES